MLYYVAMFRLCSRGVYTFEFLFNTNSRSVFPNSIGAKHKVGMFLVINFVMQINSKHLIVAVFVCGQRPQHKSNKRKNPKIPLRNERFEI